MIYQKHEMTHICWCRACTDQVIQPLGGDSAYQAAGASAAKGWQDTRRPTIQLVSTLTELTCLERCSCFGHPKIYLIHPPLRLMIVTTEGCTSQCKHHCKPACFIETMLTKQARCSGQTHNMCVDAECTCMCFQAHGPNKIA